MIVWVSVVLRRTVMDFFLTALIRRLSNISAQGIGVSGQLSSSCVIKTNPWEVTTYIYRFYGASNSIACVQTSLTCDQGSS